NGHTLIVDAGNYRLLEINEDGHLKREVHYFREGMDERFDMAYPLKMVRRENQNVVLIDANRVMEIDPLSKQIVWFSFLHELKLEIELPARLRQSEIKMPTAPAYESYEASQDPEQMFTIRRVLQKIELFKDCSPMFFDALEAKLHFRRFRDGEAILRKGQLGHCFFVLQAGHAEVLAGSSDEPTLVLEPGDSFGFMAIIFREPNKATIQAKGECGFYVLEKRDFEQLLPHYPEIEKQVRRMASERLVMVRLKQTPKSQEAASRLKSLIATHKERAHERLSRGTRPLQPPAEHQQHRLAYTEIERHVIDAAASEGLGCLEVHITLRQHARMKSARVALIASLLDRFGTIIRTDPAPDQIMQDQFENEIILTLLTQTTSEQIREDLGAVSDVQGINVFSVEP
ncbi:MAG TPA: cyclic nucleotide-binding domain-containing protein, partial [Candidatus Obscuribacterales bacterium]